jgi:hypothetical protein
MARVKIEDLPEDMVLNKNELRKILGGTESTIITDTSLKGALLAAPFFPGGTVVSAAISGLGQLKNSLGG